MLIPVPTWQFITCYSGTDYFHYRLLRHLFPLSTATVLASSLVSSQWRNQSKKATWANGQQHQCPIECFINLRTGQPGQSKGQPGHCPQLPRCSYATVSSKLDYCNSLYNGISQANLNKIQRIQNTLARVVTNTSKFEHIIPILKKLHWLPIKQRIDYKLCLLTYKTHKFSNLPIFTIVFLFLLTLCLQDHLIHRFCPSHMSEHLWVKGPFLSLLQDSGTLSHQTPVIRYPFLHSAQNPSFQVSLPPEFSPILSSDCLPGFDSCFPYF